MQFFPTTKSFCVYFWLYYCERLGKLWKYRTELINDLNSHCCRIAHWTFWPCFVHLHMQKSTQSIASIVTVVFHREATDMWRLGQGMLYSPSLPTHSNPPTSVVWQAGEFPSMFCCSNNVMWICVGCCSWFISQGWDTSGALPCIFSRVGIYHITI